MWPQKLMSNNYSKLINLYFLIFRQPKIYWTSFVIYLKGINRAGPNAGRTGKGKARAEFFLIRTGPPRQAGPGRRYRDLLEIWAGNLRLCNRNRYMVCRRSLATLYHHQVAIPPSLSLSLSLSLSQALSPSVHSVNYSYIIYWHVVAHSATYCSSTRSFASYAFCARGLWPLVLIYHYSLSARRGSVVAGYEPGPSWRVK